jgi:hypothetical protein
MSTGRAPLRLARAAIDLATALLPTPSARERYRAEFVAELYGLRGAAQLLFAVGVLTHALALRDALTRESSSFRCRVLGLHQWSRHSTEDGTRYQSCDRCGTDRGPAGRGIMTTPPWPGHR